MAWLRRNFFERLNADDFTPTETWHMWNDALKMARGETLYIKGQVPELQEEMAVLVDRAPWHKRENPDDKDLALGSRVLNRHDPNPLLQPNIEIPPGSDGWPVHKGGEDVAAGPDGERARWVKATLVGSGHTRKCKERRTTEKRAGGACSRKERRDGAHPSQTQRTGFMTRRQEARQTRRQRAHRRGAWSARWRGRRARR